MFQTVKSLLSLREDEIDVDDGDDSAALNQYDRERAIGKIILKVLDKCDLTPAETSASYGIKDDRGYSNYDIIYSEDDREATVEFDELELGALLKFHQSGLLDGECHFVGNSDGGVRMTFKVNSAVASGKAKLS